MTSKARNNLVAPAQFQHITRSTAGLTEHIFAMLEGLAKGEVSEGFVNTSCNAINTNIKVLQLNINHSKLEARPARSKTIRTLTPRDVAHQPLGLAE